MQFYDGFWFFTPGEVLLIVFGVPWTLTALLIASMIFVALSNPIRDSDADREWIARADGWIMVTALGWMILMFLVFVGSTVAGEIYKSYAAWGAGGVSGALDGVAGKEQRSRRRKAPPRTPRDSRPDIVLAIAAPVFAVILIVMTSAVLDEALFGEPLIRTASFAPVGRDEAWPDWPGGWSLMIAIGIACVLGAIASAVVNINRFSLHAMYRNRLIRGFLGASHADERKPDRFTDFDFRRQSPHVTSCGRRRKCGRRPAASRLAAVPHRQHRAQHRVEQAARLAGAQGRAVHGEPAAFGAARAAAACAATTASGSRAAPTGRARNTASKNGISLGTALAISGAAASPNMGYHSSAVGGAF